MNKKERGELRKTYMMFNIFGNAYMEKTASGGRPITARDFQLFEAGVGVALKTSAEVLVEVFPDILRLCSSCGELAGEDPISFIETNDVICQECAKEEE